MIFNEFDKNQDGILNEEEFIKLLDDLGFSMSDINSYLLYLDPLN